MWAPQAVETTFVGLPPCLAAVPSQPPFSTLGQAAGHCPTCSHPQSAASGWPALLAPSTLGMEQVATCGCLYPVLALFRGTLSSRWLLPGLTPCLHPPRFLLEDESAHLDEMPLMMCEGGFENEESDYQTLPRARAARRPRGLTRLLCGLWKLLCTK